MKKEELKRIKRLIRYDSDKMNLKDAEYYLEDLKTAIKLLEEYKNKGNNEYKDMKNIIIDKIQIEKNYVKLFKNDRLLMAVNKKDLVKALIENI